MDKMGTYGILHWIYLLMFFGVTLSESIYLQPNLSNRGPDEIAGSHFGDIHVDKYVETYGSNVKEFKVSNQNLSVVFSEAEISLDIIQNIKVEVEFIPWDEENVVLFDLQSYSKYSDVDPYVVMTTSVSRSTGEGLTIILDISDNKQTQASHHVVTIILAVTGVVFLVCQRELITSKGKQTQRPRGRPNKQKLPEGIFTYKKGFSVDKEGYMSGRGESSSLVLQGPVPETDYIFSSEGTEETEVGGQETESDTDGGHLKSDDDETSDGEKKMSSLVPQPMTGFNTLRGQVMNYLSTANQKSCKINAGKLSKPVLVCLCVTLSLAVVYAVNHGISAHHILRVFLPQSASIRKIRSYSREADLSSVTVNTSSLSLVTRLHLMEMEDTCQKNLTNCQIHAVCETGFPSMRCRCKRGFFLQDNSCVECTIKAPDGYFMMEPCRAHQDVVFRPCKKCKASQYMAAPCTTTQDTMCVDVMFPTDHFNWNNSYHNIGNLSTSITASENVFLEKIGSMKDLDTSMYVANNQLSMQFTFPRKSGLEVKVRLSEIFLVPEYVDLQYLDDSFFFDRNPYQPEDLKKRFKDIQDKYCRHPLPDHYKMILEIFNNFTSAARVIKCPPEGSSPSQCPIGHKEGDEYIRRFYSDPCPQKPGNFTPLEQRSNNIFCSGTSDLLMNTFGLTASDVTPLTFPTKACKRHHDECQACLRKKSCNPSSGLADEACCSVSCYHGASCQQAYSPACPHKPVTCASGDVYKFTVEPAFDTLQQKFMCHLKYKKPQKLYQVDYFIHIPHMNFTSKTRTRVVTADNKSYHQHGSVSADFLTFSHDTVSAIKNELIAIGSQFDLQNNVKKFKFHTMKRPKDFNRRKKFRIRPHRSDSRMDQTQVYSTYFQFERPFLYSSATWNRGECLNKNHSQIYARQALYTHDNVSVVPTIMKDVTSGQFQYQITHETIAPFIKCTLRGSESVFRHYREDMSNSHLQTGSLMGEAVFDNTTEDWNLTVKGSVSSVPAYLTMDIFDKFLATHLGYYDILVTKQTNFSVMIRLHNVKADMPDVFIVNLNDSDTSHRIIISVVDSPVQVPSPKVTTSLTLQPLDRFPWISIIVTLVLTAIVIAGFTVAAFVISQMRDENQGPFAKYAFFIIPRDEDHFKPEGSNPMFGHSKSISRGVIIVLVVLYVVYAFIFTFSMLLGVFYMIQGPLVGNLTIVSNTSAKVQEAVELHLQNMEEFESQQAINLFEETQDRVRACSHHLKMSAETNFRDVYRSVEKEIHLMYSKNKTLHHLLMQTLQDRAKVVSVRLEEYFNSTSSVIESFFTPHVEKYTEFLGKVSKVNWLDYPRSVFMTQEGIFENTMTVQSDINQFLYWLEVGKVENVLEVKDYLIHRLKKSLPKLRTDILLDENLGMQEDSFGEWSSINTQVYQKHIVLSPETYKVQPVSGNITITKENYRKHESVKAYLMTKMRDILLPVFICVFILTDLLMLSYRFTWLRQMFQKAKLGAEEKIPTDPVAKKIHFTLTGHISSQPYDPLDNPYHYYMENKEDIWAGNSELYTKFCGASPKSKEDILRDIWSRKKRLKKNSDPKEECFLEYPCFYIIRLLYKHLISPILWRFVLVGAFVLIICIVIKATNDLITLDTATFLMDTRSTLPQFHRQIDMTNALLTDLNTQANNFLQIYEVLIKNEVKLGNDLLRNIIEEQNIALQTVLSELCSTQNSSLCSDPLPQVLLPNTLTACNFLPVSVEYFRDFNEDTFMNYLNSELLPLVITLRQLLFNTCYILFAYACLMLVCHVCIRVILLYLVKTSRLPKVFMFLVSNANDCWKAHNSNVPKDMYRSNSWIESCESGVVGDIEDHPAIH